MEGAIALSDTEALKQANDLRGEFGSHSKMAERRAIISRDREPDTEALGMDPAETPWNTDAPNQEAHLYATAASLAPAQVQVYGQSEAPKTKKALEKIESFNQAVIDVLHPGGFGTCRNVADVGIAIERLDEKERWHEDVPEQGDEDTEQREQMVDNYRQGAMLPFDLKRVDPEGFYYTETKPGQEGSEVTFGAEFSKSRESEVIKDGDHSLLGELVIIRDREHIWHWFQPEGGGEGNIKTIWEGSNHFMGHTGYILYRGRYTGHPDPQRRYDPYILNTLNIAEPMSLAITTFSKLLYQTAAHWLEKELPRSGDRTSRDISTEQKLTRAGAAVRTDGGGAAMEFEPGTTVNYRDLSNDMRTYIDWLRAEDDRYRFKDVLMGEAHAGDSGRAIIRQQEAAGKQLAPFFGIRQEGAEELLRIVRRTLFGREEYLAQEGSPPIYIPRLVEGDSETTGGTFRKHELITLEHGDNVPHESRVSVTSESRAAQLALMDAGVSLEGWLSNETIHEVFFKTKNYPKEQQRLFGEEVTVNVIQAAIEDGTVQALRELGKRDIEKKELVMPPEGEQASGNGTAENFRRGGQPDEVRQEDVGSALGAEIGNVS